jgi:hypothetical protein
MIIIIIKFPCEIIILQIYDRNKYYIIEVPDVKLFLLETLLHDNYKKIEGTVFMSAFL